MIILYIYTFYQLHKHNINDLASTISASQYLPETHNTNNHTINNINTNNDEDDALTLMQSDEEEDDINMNPTNNNHNKNNGIIHIDQTLSMRQVSPDKLPTLEVGTLAFPDNIDDEEQEIAATQIDHNIDDDEADNFYAGFGVNTEPSESQAMFGLNINEILAENNKNITNINFGHQNDEIADQGLQVESATQLIDQISSHHIRYNNNDNHDNDQYVSTQIMPLFLL